MSSAKSHPKQESKSSNVSKKDVFHEQLLESLEVEFSEDRTAEPIEIWALTIQLQASRFTFKDHEYQREILTSRHQREVLKKGSQMGISEDEILKTLYGLIYARYPQGALYLFPSEKDVYDFSRARFGPLLVENPSLMKEVTQTESVTLKKVRKSMLYLRGARPTSKIEGMKQMATQLISIPVDRIVFDERDSMNDDMVELALNRLGHSNVKEEVYLGTPSLPDYGVSKLYDESDQRVWEIRCSHCGAVKSSWCGLVAAFGRPWTFLKS